MMSLNHRVKRYVVRWAIWYHLYNLKNVKNTHEGVLILVKLQATFFKLYKYYQIAQRITCVVAFIGNLDDRCFLFLDVPTLKLSIIIIILPTDRYEIILPTARTTKN